MLCRLWAIFPGRRQPSICTTAALNFRVRNGNGWTHCVKITDSLKLSPELFFCVSVELFSRAVASQVFSPLQRLTSVFGMGTGGPTALKTLTTVVSCPLFGPYTNYTIGSELWITLWTTPSNEGGLCPLVHLRGLEPRTHWLRVSCSTSWARGAKPSGVLMITYDHRKSNKRIWCWVKRNSQFSRILNIEVQALGLLVSVSWMHYCTYTSDLSNS